jgi:hypothetical protein
MFFIKPFRSLFILIRGVVRNWLNKRVLINSNDFFSYSSINSFLKEITKPVESSLMSELKACPGFR